MRQKWKVLLLSVVLLATLCGCGAKSVPSSGLVGTWKDDYGLTEYRFENDGQMKLNALHLGSFRGTYQLSGNTITLHYRVLTKDVKNTYALKVSGDRIYLNENRFTRK
jgi:hypothetical protein